MDNNTIYGIFKEGCDDPLVLSLNERKLADLMKTFPVRFGHCEVREYSIDKIDVAKTRRRLEDKIRKMGARDILTLADGLDVVFATLMLVQHEISK